MLVLLHPADSDIGSHADGSVKRMRRWALMRHDPDIFANALDLLLQGIRTQPTASLYDTCSHTAGARAPM